MSAHLQKPKPGLATVILVPLAVWIVTGIVAAVFLVLGFTNANSAWEDLARFDGGTPVEVELSDTGGYRLWVVGDTVNDESTFVSASATITGPDGETVPVSDYVGSLEYGGLDDEGVAVLTFEADQEGVYTIDASSPNATRFAVGRANPVAEVGRGVALFFAIGSIGFLIALVLFIVLMVRRSRSRKRLLQSQPPAGGFGGPPGYPQGGGFGPPTGGFGAPPGPPSGGFGPPPSPPGSSWG